MKDYTIVNCTAPGCLWLEAFQSKQAAIDAGLYHARREGHASVKVQVQSLADIHDLMARAEQAVARAGGPAAA